jgi:hypothetical protein
VLQRYSMAKESEAYRPIKILLARIFAGASGGGADRRERMRLCKEITWIFGHDYGSGLHRYFRPADIEQIIGAAAAVEPGFNRASLEPPSIDRFAELSRRLNLHFQARPDPAPRTVRGFYAKTPMLKRQLIYLNTAHSLLAIASTFCHEIARHLIDEIFDSACVGCAEGSSQVRGYAARAEDRIELAADIAVSLAAYPKPIARQILSAPGSTVFNSILDLRSRYGFDVALTPMQKLTYLAEMSHHARLREALLMEFNV